VLNSSKYADCHYAECRGATLLIGDHIMVCS
jgi:hypothetical protein